MNVTYKRPAPSVALVLICYNQEEYIKEAVLSALNQDYSPLKIIISDDYSQDNTVSIIEEILKEYNGPHEVFFNKNTVNYGLIKHINFVNDLADTELIVYFAGDDISHVNRVTEIIEAYRKAEYPPTSIYSSVNNMTPDGDLLDILIPPIEFSGQSVLECALSRALVIGASHAWHKSLFTIFGDIKELDTYEDLILAYRSSILNGLLYIDKPLVNYRINVGITSSIHNSTLSKNQKAVKSLDIVKSVLKQRLLDSNFIEDIELKKKVIKKIQRKLSKINLEYSFRTKEKIYYLFVQAIKTSTLLLFFEYLAKRMLNKYS